MKDNSIATISLLLVSIASLFVFTRSLAVNGLEFRDDEVFYVKSTQEMVASGDYMSPKYFGQDRFQKPILYYWLIILFYKIFGIGWFSARLVAAVFGTLTVCLTWKLAKDLFNLKVANISSVILITTPLFLRHAKNAVPDMPLNFFIVLSIILSIEFLKTYYNEGDIDYKRRRMILSCLFFVSCAFGFMIKGLAALAVPFMVLIASIIYTKKVRIFSDFGFLRGIIIMLIISAPWFLYMIKVHGNEYISYILGFETKTRILGYAEKGNAFVNWTSMFFKHIGFYFTTIMSYFAPWSIFFVLSIIYIICRREDLDADKHSLNFLSIWIAISIVMFSTMYFVINHYMLIITTPFAIVTSWFLCKSFSEDKIFDRTVDGAVSFFIIFILTIGTLCSVILVLMAPDVNIIIIAGLLLYYIISILLISKDRTGNARLLVISIFLFFMATHTAFLGKVGMTSHSKLQEIAKIIKKDYNPSMIVNVGSHDLHEKELQVYFDEQLQKAGVSWEQGRIKRFKKLFSGDKDFYLLILEKDFDQYIKGTYDGQYRIVYEDMIARKRTDLDLEFILSVAKLDREKVRKYLMEKVLLLRKVKNV